MRIAGLDVGFRAGQGMGPMASRQERMLIGAPRVSRGLSPGELPRAIQIRVRHNVARSAGSPSILSIAAAMLSASSGSTSNAASPTTSGSAPRLAAITGTPAAMASRAGMPKPSSNEGRTSACAPLNSASRCGGETYPR